MKNLFLQLSLCFCLFMMMGISSLFAQAENENTTIFPNHLDADEISGVLDGDVSLKMFEKPEKATANESIDDDLENRIPCDGAEGSINTIYNTNNGASGNMFDVTNVSGGPILIRFFDQVMESSAPNPATVKVWYREGGYEGFATDASAWTFLGEDNNVDAQGNNNPTRVDVGGLILLPGVTYGFFLYDTNSNTDYTNGANTYNNGDLMIETGLGRGLNNSDPFGGGVFDPRTWNGTIHYCSLEVSEPWIETPVGNDDECNFAYNNSMTGGINVIGCGQNAFPGTTTDDVNYVHQTVCGDGEITVKVESVSPNGYGGIMIRESVGANAKQVSMFSNLSNLIRWESRAFAGMPKSVQSFYKPSPFWLRLVRQGDWIFGYYSSTGYNFQPVQGAYVPMTSCVEYGMAVFSNFVGVTTTASFSNISVSGGDGGLAQIPDVDINSMRDREQARVFPNPARDNITIDITPHATQNTTIVLRSGLGQLLEQRQLAPAEFRTEWSIDNLDNGVYFIEIIRNGEIPETLRFVKNK